MNKVADFGLTEPMIKEQGYTQLSAEEIRRRIYNKTVRGEIKFFDTTTLEWRTTFKTIEEGKKIIIVL